METCHARQHVGGLFLNTVVLEAVLWEQMPSLKTQVLLDTGIKNIIETLVSSLQVSIYIQTHLDVDIDVF